jgi:hypothetical protein
MRQHRRSFRGDPESMCKMLGVIISDGRLNTPNPPICRPVLVRPLFLPPRAEGVVLSLRYGSGRGGCGRLLRGAGRRAGAGSLMMFLWWLSRILHDPGAGCSVVPLRGPFLLDSPVAQVVILRRVYWEAGVRGSAPLEV